MFYSLLLFFLRRTGTVVHAHGGSGSTYNKKKRAKAKRASKSVGAGTSAKSRYRAAASNVRRTDREFRNEMKQSARWSTVASRANYTEKTLNKAMEAGWVKDQAYTRRTTAKRSLTNLTKQLRGGKK